MPVGSTLHIVAEVARREGPQGVHASAVGRLDSPDGPVALTAAALFIQVPVEHFTTNGRPEDVDQAREDRAVRSSVEPTSR